ncbi:MAG: YdcF family protein [Oscillospiraceae bacterium]|nr:YdcF family protein [Oscillospiraceae bacterium]
MKALKRSAAAACFVLAAAILLPALAGFVHLGLLYGIYFLVLGALLWDPSRLERRFGKVRWLKGMLSVLCGLVLAVTVILSALILRAAARPTQPADTLLILGCRVDEDGPSLMLRRRMDTAIGYLQTHPSCRVIAAGGHGRGESMPEAQAIARYLEENGIAPDRIYRDERSKNTDENIRNCAEIIGAHALDGRVIIVSDGFHQYRASLLAEKYGLLSSPLSSRTPPGVAVTYWFREILGILRLYLFGY